MTMISDLQIILAWKEESASGLIRGRSFFSGASGLCASLCALRCVVVEEIDEWCRL